MKLKLKRVRQYPCECAVAACSCIANYYDKNVKYSQTRKYVKKVLKWNTSEGLESGEIGILLNKLGFHDVTIVSGDLAYLDYSWANEKKEKLIEILRDAKNKMRSDYKICCKLLYNFLKDSEYDNNLIIDYEFDKYMRKFLSRKKPMIISFNWNSFFRYPKSYKGYIDPIKGDQEQHAVVVCGFNRQGIHILDSHFEYYTGQWKQFKDGEYFMKWTQMMNVIGAGDIYMPDHYNSDLNKILNG